MAKTDLAGILAELRAADSFVVSSHPNPDGDAVGSMLALYHLLRALGKQNITCVNDDPVPRVYEWLPGAEQIALSAAPAAPSEVAVILDVASKERLGEAAQWIAPEAKLIVIDHHIEDDPCGDFVFIDAGRSAVGEIILDLFLEAGVPISREAAECLYVSIATDTGGFRYANTTARTHRAAALLLEAGVDAAGISSRVFDTMSMPKFELLGRVVERMQRDVGGRLAYASLTLRDMDEAGATHEDLDGLVNFARNIEGVSVGILFREIDAQTTKVSVRSQCQGEGFNCATFLQQFGGGGHAGAAGATLDMPLDAARSRVLERIRPLLEAGV